MAKGTIGVLVEANYQELEVFYPLLRFREEDGLKTVAIGPEGNVKYMSRINYPVTSDLGVDQVKEEDLIALVIPGGWAPDHLRRNEKIVALVKAMVESGKPVGAICRGSTVLISAKCIKGRKMTSFPGVKDDVMNAGADWEDSPVVVDGNLVTSRLPEDLPYFCKEILKLINKK